MRLVALTLIFALVVSGCLGSRDGPEPLDALDEEDDVWAAPDWAIAALTDQDFHDHLEATHHEGRTTPNFRTLGHDPMVTARAGGTSGGYLCGQIGTTEDGRSLVVTQSHFDDVVLVVADVTDPREPRTVGELVVNGLSTYDAAITEDGRYAVVGVTGGDAATVTNPGGGLVQFGFRDACGVSMGPFVRVLPAPSVLLVDLAEPSQPVIVDQVVVPGLVHSVSTAHVDGVDYVAATTVGLLQPTTVFEFYTIETPPGFGPMLVPYGHYDGGNLQSRTQGYGVANSHTDATIAKHPKTGQVLAYLANWDGGLIIVELLQRGAVVWQSDWGATAASLSGDGLSLLSVHSTTPAEALWGERHITIIGEETITPRTGWPTGLVVILDTTDPASPQEVARWTLPTDAGGWDESLIYSPHYLALVGKHVFISMYHGGVWAFDASPDHWPYPPTTGVYMPAEPNEHAPEPGNAGWAVMDFAPSILDVLVAADGSLVSFDSRGGVYTFEYEASAQVEPVENWFASR